MGNSEAEPKIQGMNFITSKKVTSNDIWSKEPGLLSQRRRSLRTEFFGAKARQWTFRITHDNCQAMDSDAEPWGPKLGLCSHAALYLKLVAFLSFPIQFISSFGCPGSWSIHLKGLPASSLDHLLSHFKIAAQVILKSYLPIPILSYSSVAQDLCSKHRITATGSSPELLRGHPRVLGFQVRGPL